ncbi:GNAT family N-acetyltransferase [Bacillus salitolerans]|uniref:GNAT family N-acetyltransferase n=1 Tax=Bacillus salitolerans TaxID=1437434 RepID=A0ABW4LS25_9BACI
MILYGERVQLRFLERNDAEEFLELLLKNKDYWGRYEPLRDEAYYTLEKRAIEIEENYKDASNGRGYSWGIFIDKGNTLIGDISLYGVKPTPFSSGSVGYSIDYDQAGNGYATEALRLVLAFAFDYAQLHRVQAGAALDNEGSIRVLEKVGFIQEGISRKNLKINGEWKDHYQYAIIDEDWQLQKEK